MDARSERNSPPKQGCLFDGTPAGPQPGVPPGMKFAADFISAPEELALQAHCETLTFKPFAFHGWFGKRETVSFGWRYDFNESRLSRRRRRFPASCCRCVRAPPSSPASLPRTLEQALVVRYDIGAGIGWHRDRPVFDRVVGISLLSRLRTEIQPARGRQAFSRFALDAQPRSAYLLTGESRDSMGAQHRASGGAAPCRSRFAAGEPRERAQSHAADAPAARVRYRLGFGTLRRGLLPLHDLPPLRAERPCWHSRRCRWQDFVVDVGRAATAKIVGFR